MGRRTRWAPPPTAPAVALLLICLSPGVHCIRRILQQTQDVEQDDSSDGDGVDRPWWIYIIIPVVSGLVGYITNVIALKMTFYPVEFWGWKLWQPKGQPFGLFGWQGIVAAKAPKMAGDLTDLFLKKLFDMKFIFDRLEPEVMRERCKDGATAISKITVDQIGMEIFPTVWTALPQYVKNEVVDMVHTESAEFIAILMASLKERILEILDVRAMVERLAETRKGLFVKMFLKVGATEYRFIELSGLYFGLLFGMVQAVVFLFYDERWVLPAAGLMVGWFTNFFALKMVFQPADPHKILCFTFQGVFLKRQKEAAVMIAGLSEDVFFRPENLMEEIMNGSNKDKFVELLDDVTEQYLQRVVNPMEKLAANMVFGSDGIEKIHRIVAKVVKDEIHNVLPLSYGYMKEALGLKATLTSKLQSLPPSEFIGTLRPVFKEDEIKLIFVGAVLGMIVGFIQEFGFFAYI